MFSTVGAASVVIKGLIVIIMITGCCSERPYRCCHLPNKVENIESMLDIPYASQ